MVSSQLLVSGVQGSIGVGLRPQKSRGLFENPNLNARDLPRHISGMSGMSKVSSGVFLNPSFESTQMAAAQVLSSRPSEIIYEVKNGRLPAANQSQQSGLNDSQQVEKKLESNKLKNPIKIWSRQSIILPHLIGKTVYIHNGIRFMPVRIIQEMVGHKYGEFSLTRKKNQRQELGSKKK